MSGMVCSLAGWSRRSHSIGRYKFAVAFFLVFFGLLGSAAAQAPQQPATGQDGSALQTGLVHIVPFGRNAGTLKNTIIPTPSGTAHLTYWGGPVVSQVHVIAVFWGPHVDASITAGIGQFFIDITSSRYYDLLTEYSTVGVTGSGVPATSSNQLIQHGVFDGSVTITPTLCNVTPPATCTIDDAQIQTELAAQIATNKLPTPVSDAQGNLESYYMIYFPLGVSITTAGVKSCVVGGFCAYHSNISNALYGVQPDFSGAGGCSTGCGTGATLFQNATSVTSHELSEAVTDAQVGAATTTGPPLAWYDPNGNNGEIGDICSTLDATVTAGGHAYQIQQEFSNLQNDCVSAPPVFNVSGLASSTQGSLFSVTLTVQSSVNASTLTGYLGTVHFTSSDALAVLPADYTFTAGDAGTHTFPVTLNSVGSQTITATDVVATGFVGSATISVTALPDLTVSKTHIGNFTQGQSGTYTITVSNTGQGATSGTVGANDTLPAGLSASAIGGTGWTCTLATLICTRSDVLAPGSSYPAITLTVHVAANAASSLTNSVFVFGGGEANTANNIANDPTVIAPAVTDLTAAVLVQGSYFQGQSGAAVSVSVNNIGTLASSGTVTLTATLPGGLTATALSGTGWTCTLANLTCTRSDAVNPGAAYPSVTLTFNIAGNASGSLTGGNVVVSGGGDANTANNTGLLSVNVQPAITFTPGASNLTVNAGQPASFVFQASLQASAGTVTFSCSGLPTGAACSFTPSAVTATTQVTATISTTARSSTLSDRFGGPKGLPPGTLMPVVLMIALLIAIRSSRKSNWKPAFACCGLLLIAALAGCGGGSYNPPVVSNPNGTPAGTFSVTITATGANGITATQGISLVVR